MHIRLPIWGSYVFVLALLYFVLLLVVALQLSRILVGRHNLASYQFIFLLLLLVWSGLRAVFWLFAGSWDQEGELVMQGVAICVQYATFGLLVTFFAQVVHKDNWAERWRLVFMAGYVVTNVVFLGVNITFFGLGIPFNPDHKKYQWLNNVSAGWTAITFFVLALVLGVYGMRLTWLVAKSKVQVPFHPKSTSWFQTALVTLILVVSFVSRAIRDTVAAAGVGVLQLEPRSGAGHQTLMFLLYFFWEIVPTLMVLLLFWSIPSANKGKKVKQPPDPRMQFTLGGADGRFPGGVDDPLLRNNSNLFSDPGRYDSDYEPGSYPKGYSYGTANSPFAIAPVYSTESPINRMYAPRGTAGGPGSFGAINAAGPVLHLSGGGPAPPPAAEPGR